MRRQLSALLAAVMIHTMAVPSKSQTVPVKLNLEVVEGEGAINNIRQRITREPIVQVNDDNHRPVAGAVVMFTLPERGAGGVFTGGQHTLTVTTGADGRAVGRGFQPNTVKGEYQIRVTASKDGQTANTAITMSNVVAAGAGAAAGGLSAKWIVILAGVGAGVAAGVVLGTRSGGNSTTTPTTGISIAAGTSTVGPPR